MAIGKAESVKDVIRLLPTDISCGANGAFAPSKAAWHRMVLNRANYICAQCGKEIPLKWRWSGQRKLARNSAHHIISQALADGWGMPELKCLLANGLANCESCHFDEHRRLGGYEFSGALQAFSRFKGLETLDEYTKDGCTGYAGLMLRMGIEMSRLYDIFLSIAIGYAPWCKEEVGNYRYENKALGILSEIFYFNVYKELESLGLNKMCEWTRDEIQSAVNRANKRWWDNDIEYLVKEYNHHRINEGKDEKIL